MSRQVTGTFTDPNGSTITFTKLIFTAVNSSVTDLPKGTTETVYTNTSGVYDVTLIDGVYDIDIYYKEGPVVRLGRVTIETGSAVDIPNLLLLHDASQVSATNLGETVGTTATQTLTNKTISDDTNTIGGGTY